MVRCVAGARRVIEEERFLWCDRFRVPDELDCFVGQILGEVVALFRSTRLVDRVVVVDEIRIPLARFGPEEPVPALEAAAGWPIAPRRGEIHLVVGAEMPLAHHVGVPALVAENLGDRAVLGRNRAACVREADCRLGDARHAVTGVISPGQQTGAGRRAECGRMPLRETDTVLRETVDVRRFHWPPVTAERREANVVENDVQARLAHHRVLSAARTVPNRAWSRGCRRR